MVTTKPFLETFDTVHAGEPDWLLQRRRSALARFGELGLPTRRQENWRFTNLRPLEKQEFAPGDSVSVAATAIAPYLVEGAGHRIVLVNGRFDSGLSKLDGLPAGVLLASVKAIVSNDVPGFFLLGPQIFGEGTEEAKQPFLALNTGAALDGFALGIPAGTKIERPIEIVHIADAASPLSVNSRSAILAGEDTKASIIETFIGTGEYWQNAVLRVQVAARAELHHVTIQDHGSEAIHTGSTTIHLAEKSRYNSFNLTVGGRLARQDVYLAMSGADATCAVDGAYLLRGSQEATMATLIDHQAPGCKTREVFKGVVEEQAHGVFQGKIQVRQAAQKTDAHQLNKNLLLGERAIVDTKPELEIFADDVKCSHGATVGDLDEAAMFYLRARGIPEKQARNMLVEAFAADAIDLVEDLRLQQHLRRHLDRWLAGRPS
ncbi:MAG: Fe-S cluster assembly protein SufD [Rhodospirillales bacterium]|nr:Fe-S cluster assembly protein SufD [Rhodospirillales bacterium]